MSAMGKNERPADSKVKSCSKSHERNVCPLEHRDEEIVLPQGTPSIEGTNVGLSAKDLEHALQFLEFCNTFSKLLLKEKELEEVVKDLLSLKGASLSVSKHKNLISKIRGEKMTHAEI